MNRISTAVWLLLIGLTVSAYVFAEGWSGGGGTRLAIILAMAGIKFSMVAWWFMELRTAAKVWASGLLLMLTAILAVIAVLA